MENDPFESYEALETYLKNLPTTWYPALIMTMLEAAWSKKVFKKGGASVMVAKLEQNNGWGQQLYRGHSPEWDAYLKNKDSMVLDRSIWERHEVDTATWIEFIEGKRDEGYAIGPCVVSISNESKMLVTYSKEKVRV